MGDRTLPAWPRAMPADLVASYVGLSRSTWNREVAAGRAPAAVRLTAGRVVWLREDLDRWLDGRGGARQRRLAESAIARLPVAR